MHLRSACCNFAEILRKAMKLTPKNKQILVIAGIIGGLAVALQGIVDKQEEEAA